MTVNEFKARLEWPHWIMVDADEYPGRWAIRWRTLQNIDGWNRVTIVSEMTEATLARVRQLMAESLRLRWTDP